MSATQILILVEHDNHTLKKTTANIISAARQLKGEIDLCVAGFECEAVAEECARFEGVRRVLWFDAPALAEGLAENVVANLLDISRQYQYILAAASTRGKNTLPRLAALLEVAQISEVIKIVSNDTFLRPIYAGNALETVQSLDTIKVMTLRPTAFTLAATQNNACPIEKLTTVSASLQSTFIDRQKSQSKRPDLQTAKIVISGGRGLQSRENFKLLEDIADKLSAAVGASRAAVDAGFVPNDYQVGQTGKVVAPDLYIAVGISGAIQHLSGMKDSKVIVAINKDVDAPIFQVADYGLVGDLFLILPELDRELSVLQEKT